MPLKLNLISAEFRQRIKDLSANKKNASRFPLPAARKSRTVELLRAAGSALKRDTLNFPYFCGQSPYRLQFWARWFATEVGYG